MNPNRKPFYPDIIIGYIAIIVLVWLFGYEYGQYVGEKRASQRPKVCATVVGMQPVSSNADSCTYIMGTMGRAYWKMLARQEEKK